MAIFDLFDPEMFDSGLALADEIINDDFWVFQTAEDGTEYADRCSPAADGPVCLERWEIYYTGTLNGTDYMLIGQEENDKVQVYRKQQHIVPASAKAARTIYSRWQESAE